MRTGVGSLTVFLSGWDFADAGSGTAGLLLITDKDVSAKVPGIIFFSTDVDIASPFTPITC